MGADPKSVASVIPYQVNEADGTGVFKRDGLIFVASFPWILAEDCFPHASIDPLFFSYPDDPEDLDCRGLP
jgi:hypothetical protein